MNATSSQEKKTVEKGKTLVIGVGNPILKDDGIGIHLVRELEKKYSGISGLHFEELSTGGLSLAEQFIGFDKVILIDALALEKSTPGKVHKLSMNDFALTVHQCSVHDCNLATAYALLEKELGPEKLPRELTIIGIEIEKVNEFGVSLSKPVKKAVPKALAMIEEELSELLQNKDKDLNKSK